MSSEIRLECGHVGIDPPLSLDSLLMQENTAHPRYWCRFCMTHKHINAATAKAMKDDDAGHKIALALNRIAAALERLAPR